MNLVTRSPQATQRLGAELGRRLQAGDLVELRGPLGAGKTVLVRGIAEGLGADSEAVRSPTFVLHQVYRGRIPVHHIDLYRLGQDADVEEFDFDTVLAAGVALVEWGEYARLQPWTRLIVELQPGKDVDERVVQLRGPAAPAFAKVLEMQ